MKKLINLIISAAIGVVVLYMISIVLAVVVLVVVLIVNRIVAYRKKHRRFTDWEYKFSNHKREIVGDRMQIKRTFHFERHDRVLNTIEIKEDIRLTPISNYNNLQAEEMAEWLAYKRIEKPFMDKKLKDYYNNL